MILNGPQWAIRGQLGRPQSTPMRELGVERGAAGSGNEVSLCLNVLESLEMLMFIWKSQQPCRECQWCYHIMHNSHRRWLVDGRSTQHAHFNHSIHLWWKQVFYVHDVRTVISSSIIAITAVSCSCYLWLSYYPLMLPVRDYWNVLCLI